MRSAMVNEGSVHPRLIGTGPGCTNRGKQGDNVRCGGRARYGGDHRRGDDR